MFGVWRVEERQNRLCRASYEAAKGEDSSAYDFVHCG